MNEPGHLGEPGGEVVQTEGGDPEPVDVMRRGRDVVLRESISAETGVNQRPAPPTPKVTVGRRFTVSSRTTHRNCAREVRHDTGDRSLGEYRRSRTAREGAAHKNPTMAAHV